MSNFNLQQLFKDYESGTIPKAWVINILRVLTFELSQKGQTLFYAGKNLCLIDKNESVSTFTSKNRSLERNKINYQLNRKKIIGQNKNIEYITSIYFTAIQKTLSGGIIQPASFIVDTQIFISNKKGSIITFFVSEMDNFREKLQNSANIPVSYANAKPQIELDDYNNFQSDAKPKTPQENALFLPKSIKFKRVSKEIGDNLPPKRIRTPAQQIAIQQRQDKNAEIAAQPYTGNIKLRDYPFKREVIGKVPKWDDENWKKDIINQESRNQINVNR